MASPWNLLGRLMPLRRRKPEEPDRISAGKTELSGNASSVEEPGDASQNTADRFGGDDPAPVDRSEEASAATDVAEHLEVNKRNEIGERTEALGIRSAKSSDAGISLVAGSTQAKGRRAAAPNKGRTPRNPVDKPGIESLSSPAVQAASDDVTILDREITDLKEQLASKLRLQNAQLKRMLQRFQR